VHQKSADQKLLLKLTPGLWINICMVDGTFDKRKLPAFLILIRKEHEFVFCHNVLDQI
jgi:hypothetical protein